MGPRGPIGPMGPLGPMGPMGPSGGRGAPHRGDLRRGATTVTATTTNIPKPTTPQDPALRDEISRSGHPNLLTLINLFIHALIL